LQRRRAGAGFCIKRRKGWLKKAWEKRGPLTRTHTAKRPRHSAERNAIKGGEKKSLAKRENKSQLNEEEGRFVQAQRNYGLG